MNQRVLFFIAGIALISMNPFFSCNKDSECNCKADSTVIAKIFQPDSVTGKDAVIESIFPDSDFENLPILSAFAWTDTGYLNIARSLLEFDLSVITPNTNIKRATLSLYFVPYANLNAQTGINNFTLYRITQAWDPGTVTWDNQPAVSSLDSVAVPKSTATNQSYINIDVTKLVQDMVNYPTLSFGFLCKLDSETAYKLAVLASSKNSDPSKRPKLVVYY